MPSSITLTVKNLPSSTSFFLSALQPLNYIYRGKVDNAIAFGTRDSPPDFWVTQETPGIPAGAAHVAFPAISQKNVQEFFIAAIKAGGKCHGEPLLRDEASGYYSAAVIDLDGNSIEAVYRPDLLESDSDRSRPNSMSSAGSVASRSQANTSVKAPTVVSKITTIRSRSSMPTEARSTAPSKAPTQVSKAPTSASRAPTQVSKAPTSASKSPTQVSKGPTQVSRAPSAAPTSVSRAPTSAPQTQLQPQTQTVTHTTPTGEVITSIFSEARNTINVAKELVNQARPALDSSNSTPNLPTTATQRNDPQSHQPSDTIVGTLLGVAAGAALHYAYTKATESKSPPPAEQQFQRPANIARTSTELYYPEEREYYYHEYSRQPYAIEAPPTEYGGSRVPSQRYITMQETDERLSEIAPTAMTGRPRRRSSFSGVDVRSFTSQSRASQNPNRSNARMLAAPPTSYRAPTAITQAESQISGRSIRSKSRHGSTARAASLNSSNSRRSRRSGSDEDLRSRRNDDGASRASRRSSKPSSRAPSVAGSDVKTVVPTKTKESVVSKATTARTAATALKADQVPLPPSRAGSAVSNQQSDYHSTHSKAHKTVIGKMIERDRAEGGRGLTKSVVGKIEDACNVDVSDREVDPSDSVSQVSSNHTRRSRRSK